MGKILNVVLSAFCALSGAFLTFSPPAFAETALIAPNPSAFDRSVEIVLRFEGGYVNNPADRGGPTKYGISKRAHPNVDIENLTVEDAKKIYYKDYWIPSGASSMKYPMSLVVFDTAVLMGVHTARRIYSISNTWEDYLNIRYQILKKIGTKNRPFIEGWLSRTRSLYLIIKGFSKNWRTCNGITYNARS